jgi:hypothetical protein
MSASSSRSVRVWLLFVTFLIFTMVAVGGLTRLTRSGLSIVEWRPITGVIPPLTEEQWQGELQKYRQTPEYQKVNKGMSVEEFKDIYWWEYGHRLLGRVIGLAFALPLVFFVWRRQVSGSLAGKLVIALVLGQERSCGLATSQSLQTGCSLESGPVPDGVLVLDRSGSACGQFEASGHGSLAHAQCEFSDSGLCANLLRSFDCGSTCRAYVQYIPNHAWLLDSTGNR